jgi:hypothetical protein
MVTSKDLLEASSFSRRRLVNAFVSGASGERQPEPMAPGRTLLGSVVLALLLLAGAAVTRFVTLPEPAAQPPAHAAGEGRWPAGGCRWCATPRSVTPTTTTSTTTPEAASAVARVPSSVGGRPAYVCTMVEAIRAP